MKLVANFQNNVHRIVHNSSGTQIYLKLVISIEYGKIFV